jgi:DNA-directed RNA polymerase specialized sigma24 family protein
VALCKRFLALESADRPANAGEAARAAETLGADLFAVDEALSHLAAEDPRAAQLVKLRFFLGMTLEAAAAHLGLQPRTAYRDWAYARAWLRRALDERR